MLSKANMISSQQSFTYCTTGTNHPAGLSKELETCVKYQSYIGWNNFMRGMLYHGWSDYQHNLATVGDKHDPNKKSIWTTNIVEAIMQIGIDVWRERCTVVKAENTETHEKR